MSLFGHTYLRSSVIRVYSISIILGLVLSAVILLFNLKSDNKSLNRKLSITSFCLFLSILLTVSVNRIKVYPEESYKVFVVDKHIHRDYKSNKKHSKRRKSYWIKVRIRDDKYISDNVLVNYNVWNSVSIGSEHVMKIRNGLLGINTYMRFY